MNNKEIIKIIGEHVGSKNNVLYNSFDKTNFYRKLIRQENIGEHNNEAIIGLVDYYIYIMDCNIFYDKFLYIELCVE